MGSISIRVIGMVLVAALAVSGAGFIASAVVTRSNVSDANFSWRQYQDDSSPKARAVDALVTNLGYGGMIHQFKNYVLRQDKPRIRKILNAAGGSLAALNQYEATGVDDHEARAIKDIRGVIELYVNNMEMVQGLAEGGGSASSIDKSVKISDKPALKGIATLMNTIVAARKSGEGANTKTEILSTLRSALGYGGMIHNFKNYVLRQDNPRIAKVRKGLAGATAAVAAYRKLGVNPEEGKALKDIAGVISSYKTNLGVAAGLAKEGKTPEQIDKTVKIDDKPALRGMTRLVAEIAAQNRSKRQNLTGALDMVETISLVVMMVAILSSAALIALSVWAINFRVVRPIRKITDTMGILADGETDFDLQGAEDSNEIGEMARAV
ncbi:MAG: HAMP domain-containing protein, partial [Alphaproteobacteria bacterium]